MVDTTETFCGVVDRKRYPLADLGFRPNASLNWTATGP